ncbi:TolB, C-terminal domain-containing protein [Thozetella sp. PMI_491]|nr:TolB, C-terminal domain-containing protein [Thozetella sp. PMI_491]
MRFSRSLKSSPHSLPSPNGSLIATLLPSSIRVRAVRSLEVINIIKLPSDCSGPVFSFQWSQSSRLVLVAVLGQLLVFSARDSSVQASIKNPVPPGAKPAYVTFGASDAEVCVFSSLGLKVTIFDLVSLKGKEIGNPKFFTASTAPNGFSFRPRTRHLALLTRTAGKDLISIHEPPTREVQRSWAPDTVDAQGLAWSPDGKWLVVWESPAHGHKVIFYTPDGHVFKTWLGPSNPEPRDKDYALGPGVKRVAFSPDGNHLAIGDSSRCVCIFHMAPVAETLRLPHPPTIPIRDTLQVWQEQVSISQTGPSAHTFVRATQSIAPMGRAGKDGSEPASGCFSVVFDSASVLVAVRLEESPGTAWIWDLAAAELRAVLLFHGAITNLSWHPSMRETLLVKCDGDQYGGLVFVWDPLSDGPQLVDFRNILPSTRALTRSYASWVDTEATSLPSVFYSNAEHCALATLAESAEGSSPWPGGGSTDWSSPTRREESPLDLIPAAEQPPSADEYGEEEASELEDTFIHKR